MRRVRSQKAIVNSPVLMFAIGVEQLINDPLFNPSRHDGQASHSFQATPNQENPPKESFTTLFKKFFNV